MEIKLYDFFLKNVINNLIPRSCWKSWFPKELNFTLHGGVQTINSGVNDKGKCKKWSMTTHFRIADVMA